MAETAEPVELPARFDLGEALRWGGSVPLQPPLPLMNEVAPAPGGLPSLADALAAVPEHRHPRGFKAHQAPYPLVPLLLLFLVGLLCGRRGYQSLAEWAVDCARTCPALLDVLGFPAGRCPRTPVAATLFRLARGVAQEPLQAALAGWLEATATALRVAPPPTAGPAAPRDQVSLDGKTLRGARRARGAGEATVHLLSAYLPALEVVLDQLDCGGKGHELAAAELLLGRLPLQDRVYPGDALFTQRTVCQTIQEGGGDSLFPVRGNQPTLLADLEEAFSPSAAAGARSRAGPGPPSGAGAAPPEPPR